MLHPDLATEEAAQAIRDRWRAEASLRISPFLAEDRASAILDALRPQAFTLMATVSANLSFQYFAFALRPDETCDHVLCEFGRWLWSHGTEWLSGVTGLDLGPPSSRLVQSTLYTRGCYLDPHNDHDNVRQVAFVFGLTSEPIAEDAGGSLEFLDKDDRGHVTVRERRLPGWNTLDIFDVRTPVRQHRIPLVVRPMERRAITGWLYQRT